MDGWIPFIPVRQRLTYTANKPERPRRSDGGASASAGRCAMDCGTHGIASSVARVCNHPSMDGGFPSVS
jgi:hypothetical protein